MAHYMSAQEVADELGVTVTTVYAYVSRGLIRSEAVDGSKRTRRYYRQDVERLKRRQAQRRNPEFTAETALDWGAPLLESSLTLIADGHLYYRGQDALELAENQSIEAVASLLWTDEPDAKIPGLYADGMLPMLPQFDELTAVTPIERMQALLPLAAMDDPGAYDLRPSGVIHTGSRIVRLLTAVSAGQPAGDRGIAETLQRAWTPGDDTTARLINMALVLCADHELNVSSFTARCVASAGSTPYAVVIAALAALQGTRHGGSTARVAALLREIEQLDNKRGALVNRLKRGDSLPGFGHRLYTEGDPRGRLLLDMLRARSSESSAVKLADEVTQQVYQLTGEHPNIDFGLVILAQSLGLPEGAPLALFALGRSVGWIGHALEQYSADRLIRPRARYVGKLPQI